MRQNKIGSNIANQTQYGQICMLRIFAVLWASSGQRLAVGNTKLLSYKQIQLVPAWLEEHVSPVKKPYSGGIMNEPYTLSQDAFRQCNAYSAEGGGHEHYWASWNLLLVYLH